MNIRDAIKNFNYSEMVNCRDELRQLGESVQLELFTDALSIATHQNIKNTLLIIDTYCPSIEIELLCYAIRTQNTVLFRLLCDDYVVVNQSIFPLKMKNNNNLLQYSHPSRNV